MLTIYLNILYAWSFKMHRTYFCFFWIHCSAIFDLSECFFFLLGSFDQKQYILDIETNIKRTIDNIIIDLVTNSIFFCFFSDAIFWSCWHFCSRVDKATLLTKYTIEEHPQIHTIEICFSLKGKKKWKVE